MSLSWSSVGHGFASGFSAIARGAKYLIGASAKIEDSEKVVESLSSLIPGYGPILVELERYAYAGLGMIVGGLHYGGAAFEQNLLSNGADQAAIDEIKTLIQKFPGLVADVEAVFGKPSGSVPVVAVAK
jgi:hypothetical protein